LTAKWREWYSALEIPGWDSEMGRESVVQDELVRWFEREGMLRYRIESGETGEVVEEIRAPMIALGPHDEDWVWPSNPDCLHYPWKHLVEMTLDDFNDYIYRWFEVAVGHGVIHCAHCGRLLVDGDDLPDVDTWDALLLDKELVGWLAVHFDCKKQLPKKLKGLHAFELEPHAPPLFDLAHVPRPNRPSDASAERT
jgi:hypothetical protein